MVSFEKNEGMDEDRKTTLGWLKRVGLGTRVAVSVVFRG
jgi:hypothetical protein